MPRLEFRRADSPGPHAHDASTLRLVLTELDIGDVAIRCIRKAHDLHDRLAHLLAVVSAQSDAARRAGPHPYTCTCIYRIGSGPLTRVGHDHQDAPLQNVPEVGQ